jgi:hypothetical protein
VALKRMVESGMLADGFILSEHTMEREGMRLDDLPLVEQLGEASVEIRAKTLLSRPPEGRPRARRVPAAAEVTDGAR